ncbi:MAG: isoprenylcysteine carboxylmethyltransferase family protein [Melioribacteraceae bacterium]
MDAINIIVAVNLFVSMSANISGAKKGMKSKMTSVAERPKNFLQKVPPNIAALVLILTIAAIFNLGVFSEEVKAENNTLRIVGLIIFIAFSWIQVLAYKALGDFYSQDIVIFKKHELQTKGFYKLIRHPQYLSQILSDIGVAIALMGYLVIPIVILVELPLFIMRAKLEDKLLLKHLKDEFVEYKKSSGFIIPFIG